MVFISLLSENATNHEYSPEAWFINSLQPSLDNDAVVREEELTPGTGVSWISFWLNQSVAVILGS